MGFKQALDNFYKFIGEEFGSNWDFYGPTSAEDEADVEKFTTESAGAVLDLNFAASAEIEESDLDT